MINPPNSVLIQYKSNANLNKDKNTDLGKIFAFHSITRTHQYVHHREYTQVQQYHIIYDCVHTHLTISWLSLSSRCIFFYMYNILLNSWWAILVVVDDVYCFFMCVCICLYVRVTNRERQRIIIQLNLVVTNTFVQLHNFRQIVLFCQFFFLSARLALHFFLFGIVPSYQLHATCYC